MQNPSLFTFPLQKDENEAGARQVPRKMKAAFPRFNSSRNNLPLPSSTLHPSPTFNAPKCILFLNVKEKKKKKKQEGGKTLLLLNVTFWGGEKGERTCGRIKEMQIFLSPCPYSGLSCPSHSPPWVALRCQMQPFAAETGVPGGNRLPF